MLIITFLATPAFTSYTSLVQSKNFATPVHDHEILNNRTTLHCIFQKCLCDLQQISVLNRKTPAHCAVHSYAQQYFKSISEPLLYSAVLIWKVSLHCSAAHTVIDRSCKPLERLQETNIPVVRMRVRTMMMALVMITMMWYCFFLQMMIIYDISYIWASRKTAEEEHSCGGDEDGNSDDDNGNDDDDLILLFFRWWSYHTHEATL